MPSYQWICHLCRAVNAADEGLCTRCTAPSELSAIEIERGVCSNPVDHGLVRSFGRWLMLVGVLVLLMLLIAFAVEAGVPGTELGLIGGLIVASYLWTKGLLTAVGPLAIRVAGLVLLMVGLLAIIGERSAFTRILLDHAPLVLVPVGWAFAMIGLASLLPGVRRRAGEGAG